ncbi:TIGR04282 family arsenosugar biosynthesis glycosyltransferase [Rasiella sp. SM2506]|uniref:TIGR04282 family arsenosugar biosynthesis glycosyltransferase n=1 Tax=Rasiella sp. SM2506 TaxID=3423914 RepID=UPI003D7AA194
MNKTTAILIFANSAQQEGISKPFRSSQLLFDELNRLTIAKVQKTGLPYFLFSEKEQVGNTFGERYSNAIQSVYTKGYENVITIGNDTPHLQTSQLLKTAKHLETQKIVLGPSKDGGYYLMGLHKSQFNLQTFLKLPWQTSRLTQSIARLVAAKKTHVVFLKILQDIDTVSDVQSILNSFRSLTKTIRQLLRTIISGSSQLFSIYLFLTASFQNQSPFNKGSPVILPI